MTAAELVSEPVLLEAIASVTVKVAVAPTGRLTVELIEPLPEAVHDPPPVVAHVHVIDVTPAGIASVTEAPTTADGPALLTTTV